MCGIAGLIDKSSSCRSGSLETNVRAMISCLHRRGPDSEGVWVDNNACVALGHRRLAVIDLSSSGAQPMKSMEGRFVISFNGEIYNFRDLRKDLLKCGCRFKGNSDTEVLLQGICIWGIEEVLRKVVGMFAFALWDQQTQTLYLARDRMGEKPLYYGWCGSVFAFGSELKALRELPDWQPEIDHGALAAYFRYSYIPEPYSIYQGVLKLLPGSWLSLPANRLQVGILPNPVRFWSLSAVAKNGFYNRFQGSEEEAIRQLDALLKLAIAGQMVSDVPLGAFLSGGVDSSTIVALMQSQSTRPVKTFTIGFDDIAYDESKYAKSIAECLGTDHMELRVTSQDVLNVIPRIPEIYDEPFADSSQIPTFLLAQMTRKYVTVSLSGDGGDEVFCGYNRHVKLDAVWRRCRHIPPALRRVISAMLQALPSDIYERFLRNRKHGVLADQVQKISNILRYDDAEQMYLSLTSYWEDPARLVLNSSEATTLLSKRYLWPMELAPLDRLLYLECMTSLPGDILVKVDRAAMAVSLETRIPLLDHRVIEFVWSLPFSMRLHAGIGKWILRQVLYHYVPKALIDRPKSGFSVPIDNWLKTSLRAWAEELLDERRLRRQGILDPQIIRLRWEEHLSGRRKWQYHLWGVLMFQSWLDYQKADKS